MIVYCFFFVHNFLKKYFFSKKSIDTDVKIGKKWVDIFDESFDLEVL